MDNRRNTIRELLEKNGEVHYDELIKLFPGVSVMTLRRDLQYFQDIDIAFRIHGGARIKEFDGREPFYKARETKNKEAKNKIAYLALRYIQEGASIFLDSGTTMMSFARALKSYNLNIITTGPNIALELAPVSNSSFILLGGQLNRDNLTVSGPMAVENLGGLRIDTAFMAASGFTLRRGFTCGSHNEADLKKFVLGRAVRRILLMDSGKIGQSMMFNFADVGSFNCIITERRPPEDIMQEAAKHGTQVIYEE